MKASLVKKGLLYLLLCLLTFGLFPARAHAAFKLPVPEKISLPNGLTVFYWPNHELPLVSFRLLIAGAGSASEPAELEGLANLVADLLLKGAGQMGPEEVAEAVDFMGASLDFSATEEYISGSGECLSEHFPQLLRIAYECLSSPWFKEEELRKEQARRVDSIKAIKDNPAQAVRYYFTKAYFGSHPLGHVASGTEISLPKITADNLKAFYAERFRPERTLLAVVGNIERKELLKLLALTLGQWRAKKGAAPAATIPPLPQPKGKRIILVDKPDATQAYFILGSPGFKMGDEVSPAANVMNTLWGGRFTSWLNTELRIKRGLTYGARSSFQSWKTGGIFTASSYTKNEQLEEMLKITLDLLRKARAEGFAGEEVESAKNYILGQFPPTLETNASKASAYVRLTFYGLGFDYYDRYLSRIEKMDVKEVANAAASLLPQDDYIMVVVGKASEIREVLRRLGPVEEKKITDPGF